MNWRRLITMKTGARKKSPSIVLKIDSTPKIRLAELMLFGIRRRQFIVL